jgi:PAS domain S-box-containing protein
MAARLGTLFHNTFVKYLFAIITVAITFAIRVWLIPFTGTGAPFVLFFAAVLVTSLAAGTGPGICAIVLSAPLAAYTFVTRAGDPPFQAAVLGVLFAVDGIVVIYLASLMRKERQAAEGANERLRWANEEIIGSMARTREVIELAPDAFFQADLDGRFTDVNQAACRLLGYERDELIGKTIFDIIPAEDADRLRAVRADLLLPGRVHTAEWTQQRKDGTFVPVEVSSNILPDRRWQAFVRDVSERKHVEQALHESEERFRLTIDEAPIGMALVALDGRFVRVNRALCEIVGYSSAELTGLTFQAITHPDDRDADLASAGQLARGDIPLYHREKRYVRKDGTIVEVLLNVSILRNRDGRPIYFISQIEDITARKRAEEALQTSERELRELADSMPQIVWTTSADGRTIYFNRQWVEYTGLTLEESYGEGWITAFHPDDRKRAWDAWQRAVQHRDTYSLECRLRRADGVYRWWLIRGVPLLSANGEIRKWFRHVHRHRTDQTHRARTQGCQRIP